MSPKQADKIVKSGKATAVRSIFHKGEPFVRTFVKRDRLYIYSDDGGVFDRGDLEIVTSGK